MLIPLFLRYGDRYHSDTTWSDTALWNEKVWHGDKGTQEWLKSGRALGSMQWFEVEYARAKIGRAPENNFDVLGRKTRCYA